MKKILFVCLGNICRSPAAEAVMLKLLAQKGLSQQFACDSAGTIGMHEGQKADKRMIQQAAFRNIKITSISRKFRFLDFEIFDYIVAMDDQNYKDIQALDEQNEYTYKLIKMTDYSSSSSVTKVPDPYYGGTTGFDDVLNILQDCCENFLQSL